MRLIAIFILCLFHLTIQAQLNFTEEDVKCTSPSCTLSGSLLVPNNSNQPPVAIIIPGSGPVDRNGNAGLMLYTNAYQMLAKALGNNQIATLRFDKRGSGKSTPSTIKTNELKLDHFVNDVINWIDLINESKRFGDIYLIGHSQGSLIGILAAHKRDVAGLISIAGAGKPIDVVLKEQLKPKLPEELYHESARIIDTLKTGETVDQVNPFLMSVFNPQIQPFLMSWMKYDPCTEIAKLTIPTLIINGSTDIQVSTHNAMLLHEAAQKSEFLLIDQMNHIMKEAPADTNLNMATYNNGKLPLKAELTEAIVTFINYNR